MKRNRLKIVLVMLMCLGSLAVLLVGYTEPNDSVFAVDAFYEGTKAGSIDYKAMYDSWYVGLAPGSGACKAEMEVAVSGADMENGSKIELCMAPSAVWIAPHIISSNDEMGANQSVITPYEEGDVIISPGHLKFLNQNLTLNENSEPYIEAVLNDTYKIRWDNISCWWCHVGKDNKNRHTKRIGKGGAYSECMQGYIIGEAKAETSVSFYRVDVNGDWVDTTVGDVLGYFQ